jgi:hypothetical protein
MSLVKIHPQTTGVRFYKEGDTEISIEVYKAKHPTELYTSGVINVCLKGAANDVIYQCIHGYIPLVPLKQWKDLFLTINAGTSVPKLRNTGHVQTEKQWEKHFLDIKQYLLNNKVSSCKISVFIDTNENHATHAAHAPAATHTRPSRTVMNADLHQLLERLQAP